VRVPFKLKLATGQVNRNIEDQKTAVSGYLNKRFGRWIDGGLCYDT
jgi:hypothetical protein